MIKLSLFQTHVHAAFSSFVHGSPHQLLIAPFRSLSFSTVVWSLPQPPGRPPPFNANRYLLLISAVFPLPLPPLSFSPSWHNFLPYHPL